jgi:hypothetical protein
MNLNPFKNTYKIVENSNLKGEKYFTLSYGNFFSREFLDSGATSWCNEDYLGKYGGHFENLNNVKKTMKIHMDKLNEKRLSKVFSKTIINI